MIKHKYRAIATVVDGIKFPSKKEARRYGELKLMEKANEIHDLELQPAFMLEINGNPILLRSKGYPNGRKAKYVADFRYYDCKSFEIVVEDTKGMDTPLSKLKRGIVEAQYGIRIVLT